LKDRIHEENRLYMATWREEFWSKWGTTIKQIVSWSAKLDVWSSFAYISAKYGYHRPTIVESEKTVIRGKDLRHPMIERLQEDVAGYVANDIDLNDTKRGMLLYGMNASGKSSYMKSVGLALIMSQAGCWVPCQNFHHSIVSKLFTRISGNDDYMRGKSSFALEMEELSTILQSACSQSVVLGDELCRGTEQVSGTAIVGAGVHSLLQRNVAFVFATHLHDLPHLSLLQSAIHTTKSLGVYHLRVVRDKDSDQLIYERTL
jgi:DNA mismatch repair protein MutS